MLYHSATTAVLWFLDKSRGNLRIFGITMQTHQFCHYGDEILSGRAILGLFYATVQTCAPSLPLGTAPKDDLAPQPFLSSQIIQPQSATAAHCAEAPSMDKYLWAPFPYGPRTLSISLLRFLCLSFIYSIIVGSDATLSLIPNQLAAPQIKNRLLFYPLSSRRSVHSKSNLPGIRLPQQCFPSRSCSAQASQWGAHFMDPHTLMLSMASL